MKTKHHKSFAVEAQKLLGVSLETASADDSHRCTQIETDKNFLFGKICVSSVKICG